MIVVATGLRIVMPPRAGYWAVCDLNSLSISWRLHRVIYILCLFQWCSLISSNSSNSLQCRSRNSCHSSLTMWTTIKSPAWFAIIRRMKIYILRSLREKEQCWYSIEARNLIVFQKKIIVFNQRNGSKNLPHLTSRNFQRIALANVVHTELLYRRVPFVAPRFEELTIASNLRRHTFLNFSDRFISLLCAICMNFNT